MTSPCLTLHEGSEFSHQNCSFYYFTSVKKRLLNTHPFYGTFMPEWSCNEERFDYLANWALDKLPLHDSIKVGLEGYAYNATGSSVFEIAENTAILKHHLWKAGITPVIVPPPAIKKSATGKGNSSKYMMIQHFRKVTGIDLEEVFKTKGTDVENPTSDIADSFFLCRYLIG